jgi:hypothetical protein
MTANNVSMVHDEEAIVRALLAPLRAVDAVPLPRRVPRRRTRPLVVLGIAACVAAIAAGIAVAAGVNPFAGIGQADHPQTAQDVLSSAAAAQLQANVAPGGHDPNGVWVLSSARLVGALPSGGHVYVVSTATDKLCVVIDQTQFVDSCGAPLTQSEPITAMTVDVDGSGPTPALSYGVARDDVSAVSFVINGVPTTVPVKDNVWFFEGGTPTDLTVHYTDGSSSQVGP